MMNPESALPMEGTPYLQTMPASWAPRPAAEGLLRGYFQRQLEAHHHLLQLKDRLFNETSTRLFDWVDHLVIGYSEREAARLVEVGFAQQEELSEGVVYRYEAAHLPAVLMRTRRGPHMTGVAVKVDSIGDFLMVRGHAAAIEGSPMSCFRRCCLAIENGVALWVVERRGSRTLIPDQEGAELLQRLLWARERWLTRPRDWEDEAQALNQAQIRAQEIVATIGPDRAAAIALAGERAYWEARNRAGQLQKNRQDRLGMGWANAAHHAFRSSRAQFRSLIRLFETLGFTCQQRFYLESAGGLGVEILEQVEAGLTVTCSVDLREEEAELDFAHHPLPAPSRPGTVGLWCALHGESILRAGMSYLTVRLSAEELGPHLEQLGISMREAKQLESDTSPTATHPEIWPVHPRRLRRLLREGVITHEEADHLLNEGGAGSYLESRG